MMGIGCVERVERVGLEANRLSRAFVREVREVWWWGGGDFNAKRRESEVGL